MTDNETTRTVVLRALCTIHHRSARTIENALTYGERDMCRQYAEAFALFTVERIRRQTAAEFAKKKGAGQ
ncbi:TPA: hypothetical protein QDB28_004073 [Burkholderia vietnamiensis]|nr:hypothetical protein [Burkholderia vietnamiensis]